MSSGSSQLSSAQRRDRQSRLSIDGRPHTIVGVLPCGRQHRGIFRTIDAVTPIVLDRERNRRDDRRLFVTAVLKPGVALEQAQAELAAVARQLQTDYPLHERKNRRRRAAAASSCSAPTSTLSCICCR